MVKKCTCVCSIFDTVHDVQLRDNMEVLKILSITFEETFIKICFMRKLLFENDIATYSYI